MRCLIIASGSYCFGSVIFSEPVLVRPPSFLVAVNVPVTEFPLCRPEKLQLLSLHRMSDIVPVTFAVRLSENLLDSHVNRTFVLAPVPKVIVASVVLIVPLVIRPSAAARRVRVIRPLYLNCQVQVPRDSRSTC